MRLMFEISFVFLAIIICLQVGYNREETGYYIARLEECAKMLNSSNYAMSVLSDEFHSEYKRRWADKEKCQAMMNKEQMSRRVWFWEAPARVSHYNDLWHY